MPLNGGPRADSRGGGVDADSVGWTANPAQIGVEMETDISTASLLFASLRWAMPCPLSTWTGAVHLRQPVGVTQMLVISSVMYICCCG